MKDPDRAAYYLWAADHDPESIDGAVGYVLRAQEMHDLRELRRLVRVIGIGAGVIKES